MGTYNGDFYLIPDKDYWTQYNGPRVVFDIELKQTRVRPSKRLRNEMDEVSRGR